VFLFATLWYLWLLPSERIKNSKFVSSNFYTHILLSPKLEHWLWSATLALFFHLFAFWMIVDRRHNASWLIVVAAQRQRLWLPIEEVLDNITSATDTHCLIIVYQRRISYSVHVFGSPVTSRWPMAHGLWHRAPGNPRQTCVSSPWLIKSSASSGIGLQT